MSPKYRVNLPVRASQVYYSCSSVMYTTWLTQKVFCLPVISYTASQNGETQGGDGRLKTRHLLTLSRNFLL